MSDWTSVSDIGKVFNEKLLTVSEYLCIEDSYIESILMFMKLERVKEFKIVDLEKHKVISHENITISKELRDVFDQIKNNDKASIGSVPHIIRLVLREFIWCKLISPFMEVYFGYDYYMYVALIHLDREIIEKIEDLGLFVEKIDEIPWR